MMKYRVLIGLLICSFNALSGVMPEKSRIVYHEQSHMQSSVLVNTNAYPVMVQLWVDDGDFKGSPETASAPFVVTPVMFKLNPMQLNGIKVIYSGKPNQLAGDRETLFWLNILEVPPKPEEKTGEERVSLSMLTQLKLIYRPKSLNIGEEKVVAQWDKLTFSVSKGDANGFTVKVNNPTPYVASFSTLQLSGKRGAQTVRLTAKPEIDLLVLPMSNQVFQIDGPKSANAIVLETIDYALVDDSGRYIKRQRKL
jgi:P pilus assembly chaperone PapD